jgi:hypothetical protein
MASIPSDPNELLNARVRVPSHVVYRDFGGETVILNLDSGMYHGLNGTAAAMVKALDEHATVEQAVVQIAAEYNQPLERIERDVVDLCGKLLERGLVETDAGGNA